MNIEEKLTKLKAETLKKIEQAAQNHDTSAILNEMANLQETVRLIEKVADTKNSIMVLEKNVSIPNASNLSKESELASSKFSGSGEGVSAKFLGKKRRTDFLSEAKNRGINLAPVKGVRYQKGDNVIGIASASERNADHWFLGLPPDEYDGVVLLCEMSNGTCLRFIVGEGVYKKVSRLLTKDKNGQLKFNVSKKSQQYFLQIPGREPISIAECVDNWEGLRSL